MMPAATKVKLKTWLRRSLPIGIMGASVGGCSERVASTPSQTVVYEESSSEKISYEKPTPTPMRPTIVSEELVVAKVPETPKDDAPEFPNVDWDITEALSGVDIAAIALKKGDHAQDFSLKNPTGDTVTLSQVLQQGSVILVWFPGMWDEASRKLLASVQEDLDSYRQKGCIVLGISPQNAAKNTETKDLLKLEYEILSDPDNAVAELYGVKYDLKRTIREIIDIQAGWSSYYQPGLNSLPVPAIYGIDMNGVIEDQYLNLKPVKPLVKPTPLKKNTSAAPAPSLPKAKVIAQDLDEQEKMPLW